MLDENLISTLESSLRQTRNAQTRLLGRLREVESEAERLRQEIEALENSASQTEAAIFSLLASIGSGNLTWNTSKKPRIEENYEVPSELQRQNKIISTNQNQSHNQNPPQHYNRGGSVSYINNPRNVPSISHQREPISHRFAERTITQACSLLLRETGEPLHVNELYNLLVAGGMEFTGNNPTISIAVSLNRNRRFKKVAPGTFDLVMRDASQAIS
ncbi:MAG TPA: hypothetical protein PKY82_29090 [Pyrinomonadaceae bacterium]|nr:hypothetical protein [Pyrinomonadaceae bacterium]